MTFTRAIALQTVFNALSSVTVACHRISGEDNWRQTNSCETRMKHVDAELANELLQPPSKPRQPQQQVSLRENGQVDNNNNTVATSMMMPPSVWSKIHFSVLLPALRRLKTVMHQSHRHDFLQNGVLSLSEMSQYLDIVPELVKALRRMNQVQSIALIWNELLKKSEEGHMQCEMIDRTELFRSMLVNECGGRSRENGEQMSFEHEFLSAWNEQMQCSGAPIDLERFTCETTQELFHAILQSLPDHPEQLVPFFRHLIEKVNQNDVLARLLVFYYIVERGVPFEYFDVFSEVGSYFGRPGLSVYERVAHYLFYQLPSCPLQLVNDEEPSCIPVRTVFDLYSDWYQRPKVVEMVLPNFIGAGFKTSKLILNFIEHVKNKTNGEIDCTNCILKTHNDTTAATSESTDCESEYGGIQGLDVTVSSLSKDMNQLRKFGRLAMFIDCIGNGNLQNCKGDAVSTMNSDDLLELCYVLWSEDDRRRVWGHALRYTPNPTTSSFSQDVTSVIHATSLSIKDHSTNNERSILVGKLQALSRECRNCKLFSHFQTLFNQPNNLQTLYEASRITLDIEQNPSNTHKTPYSREVLYLCRLFVDPMLPCRIPMSDIRLGFSELSVSGDGSERTLTISFREAKDSISFAILMGNYSTDKQIEFSHQSGQFIQDDLVYPDSYLLTISTKEENGSKRVRVPKIGRECYDLLGRTADPHAGLVIGYGCSVFHSSLQFIQLTAASHGFYQPEHLRAIQSEMFKVNPSLHHRHMLATFHTDQLIQVIHSKECTEAISYRQYIVSNPTLLHLVTNEPAHQHCLPYINHQQQGMFKDYTTRMAFLQYHYPDLYPTSQTSKELINPRVSFYDGSNVTIHSE